MPDVTQSVSICQQAASVIRGRPISSTRHFKLDFVNDKQNQSLHKLMTFHSWNRKSLKRQERKFVSTTLCVKRKYHLYERNRYQLRFSRRLRPLNDLSCLNYFPAYKHYKNYPVDDENYYDLDLSNHDNRYFEQAQYNVQVILELNIIKILLKLIQSNFKCNCRMNTIVKIRIYEVHQYYVSN